MNEKSTNCLCQKGLTVKDSNILEIFSHVRNKCPVLKELLVPDSIWPDFRRSAIKPMNGALHKSILLLALHRGYLNKITLPMHKYLIENGNPRKEITKQYIVDLQETWLQEDRAIERNRKSRIYIGKLTELILADWLEEQGWRITNLEALGGQADIETVSPQKNDHAIEVKYVGYEDENFLSVVESLSGKAKAYTTSPYAASDFLLFKVYGAAKQLFNSAKTRIAFLAISNMTWDFVDIQLSEDWMNWQSPRFFNNDTDWKKFLEKNKNQFPTIESDLRSVIRSLNQLWILREEKPFQYSLQQVIHFQ